MKTAVVVLMHQWPPLPGQHRSDPAEIAGAKGQWGLDRLQPGCSSGKALDSSSAIGLGISSTMYCTQWVLVGEAATAVSFHVSDIRLCVTDSEERDGPRRRSSARYECRCPIPYSHNAGVIPVLLDRERDNNNSSQVDLDGSPH